MPALFVFVFAAGIKQRGVGAAECGATLDAATPSSREA